MLPITTSIPGHDLRVHDVRVHDVRVHDLVAVFRLLGVPTHELPAVLHRSGHGRTHLPLGPSGRLQLTEPFSVVAGTAGRWRTRARLFGTGIRLVPYTRVVVELSSWSPDASELRLRPVSRAPHAWGVSRLRRYLRLAPLAADALATHLVDQASALRQASSAHHTRGAAASAPERLAVEARPLEEPTVTAA